MHINFAFSNLMEFSYARLVRLMHFRCERDEVLEQAANGRKRRRLMNQKENKAKRHKKVPRWGGEVKEKQKIALKIKVKHESKERNMKSIKRSGRLLLGCTRV